MEPTGSLPKGLSRGAAPTDQSIRTWDVTSPQRSGVTTAHGPSQSTSPQAHSIGAEERIERLSCPRAHTEGQCQAWKPQLQPANQTPVDGLSLKIRLQRAENC